MQKNSEKEESTIEELIKRFNAVQLSTMRYEKHFDTMESVIIREHWEEMDQLITAAKQCENHICKIREQLKRINLLFNNESKRVS